MPNTSRAEGRPRTLVLPVKLLRAARILVALEGDLSESDFMQSALWNGLRQKLLPMSSAKVRGAWEAMMRAIARYDADLGIHGETVSATCNPCGKFFRDVLNATDRSDALAHAYGDATRKVQYRLTQELFDGIRIYAMTSKLNQSEVASLSLDTWIRHLVDRDPELAEPFWRLVELGTWPEEVAEGAK